MDAQILFGHYISVGQPRSSIEILEISIILGYFTCNKNWGSYGLCLFPNLALLWEQLRPSTSASFLKYYFFYRNPFLLIWNTKFAILVISQTISKHQRHNPLAFMKNETHTNPGWFYIISSMVAVYIKIVFSIR